MHRLAGTLIRLSRSLITGLALAASPVVQAAPSSDATGDARNLYSQGRAAFDAGNFDRAAQLFDEAYEKAKNPNLRYNAAVAYEEAGNLTMAHQRLLEYRSEAPPSEYAEIDAEVARIEELSEPARKPDDPSETAVTASRRDSAAEAPSETANSPTEPDGHQARRTGHGALIATGAISGTAGLLAVGFGLAALQRKNAVEDECALPESGATKPLCLRPAKDLEQDRRLFAAVTDASIGVAAASAIVFTVLLIRARRRRTDTARATVTPTLGSGQVGANFTARF